MLPRRHIPNAITLARLVLTAACIACLSLVSLSTDRTDPWLTLGLVLFVVAAGTDWLDGYLARRWQVISRFGRVLDPLADKVLILGVFTVLAGPSFIAYNNVTFSGTISIDGAFLRAGDSSLPHLPLTNHTGVYPWMVVLMLVRELLVTGLRSVMESSGTAFGAVMLGKLKMVLQSITIPLVLLVVMRWHESPGNVWIIISRDVLIYATVLVTVLSAWPYVAAAMRANTQHNPKPRQVTPDR
ncbi:MAG: CDP-alcohol phosphatidyltransferase family protein [Planctomycetota bacterium]